jgi:hypothetical protein
LIAFAATMKPKRLGILLVSLLIAQVFLNYSSLINAHAEQKTPDIFIGIDVAYENLTEIKKLIDEVSSYTNLFVIGCTGITQDLIRNATSDRIIGENLTKLEEICQYAYDKGMSFMIYRDLPYFSNRTWPENARTRWGDKFLGFYFLDEIGGRQLDRAENWTTVTQADNYTHASSRFIENVSMYVDWYSSFHSSRDFRLFTSDYALYWFDYKSGYDALLAQFGWNYSRQLNIALCRGAATVQNKDWGVMITWTYTEPPYIESGEELYKDLILAYENDAKYIAVFDSNENYTQGILKEEHLDALKQFWQYVQDNPRKGDEISDRVAYVLPKDYGYGFRGPNDKIWGLWEADPLSYNLSVSVNSLLEEYGTKLDIIYDDGLALGSTYGYSRLISWNSTSPSPSPSPSQQPTSPSPMDYAYSMATGVVITAVVAAVVLRKRR